MEFPAKRKRPVRVRVTKTVLLIERSSKVLLQQRQGFWELPEADQIPNATTGTELGHFRHTIMNRDYTFTVASAKVRSLPPGFRWISGRDLARLPVSTVARKAMAGRVGIVFSGDQAPQ